ncbi:MAG: DUF4493 domain-containing protein [Tannerellaceae bacterium]|nr:DUF4493 domain-containing protein [Tannerellaceae bacterium]
MRTPISDTATLANTRVFVNYTEDFIDAYEEFRIRMNTEYMGADTLSFKEDETWCLLQVGCRRYGADFIFMAGKKGRYDYQLL